MVKTNVMRLLDAARIVYETGTYEVDENDLSGSPENYELLDMDDFLPAEPAEMKPTIQRIRRST